VQEEFNAFNFIHEDSDTQECLKAIVEQGIAINNCSKFFSFMVDDMLFYRKFDLMDTIQTLHTNSDCFALHLKLHPGIRYSHTNNKAIQVPTNLDQVAASFSDDTPVVSAFEDLSLEGSGLLPKRGYKVTYLKYKRADTDLDWNYPFDFCGSFYELSHVLRVIDALPDKQMMNKPNTFEFQGN
jgi:hypothetical protein